MRVHPVAALFPMMSDEELDDLARDIQVNGLIDPLVIDKDGVLLEGRNRKEACRRAGIEPRYETLNDGHDPTTFILSKNASRRHMTKAQLALVIVKAKRGEQQSSALDSNAADVWFSELASEYGVSRTYFSQAALIWDYAPEWASRVIAGNAAMSSAYAEAQAARRAHESQAAALEREDAELAALRREASDLADLVVEERLTLAQAQAALSQRQEADLRQRTSLSNNLAQTLLVLAPGNATPADLSEMFLRADPLLVQGNADPDLFATRRVEYAIQTLSAWVAHLTFAKEPPQ